MVIWFKFMNILYLSQVSPSLYPRSDIVALHAAALHHYNAHARRIEYKSGWGEFGRLVENLNQLLGGNETALPIKL